MLIGSFLKLWALQGGCFCYGINVLLRNLILLWVDFLFLVSGVVFLMALLRLVLGYMALRVILLGKIYGWN